MSIPGPAILAILLLLAAAVVLLNEWFHRRERRISKLGEDVVRARLIKREDVPLEKTIDALRPWSPSDKMTERLLRRIARDIRIPPEKLRGDDTLADFLVVDREELPKVSDEDWDNLIKTCGRLYLDPGWIEDVLPMICNMRSVTNYLTAYSLKFYSDDEMEDLLLEMSIREFLDTVRRSA